MLRAKGEHDDGYMPQSLERLLTALIQNERTAREAAGDYVRIKEMGRTPMVELHAQLGWRVRDPREHSA